MNAPSVLLALVEAGVVLWLDGDRLRFRAPEGVLDEARRAQVASCRSPLVALVRAGALLPEDPTAWPEEAREEAAERAAIMEFDGRLPREDAERGAERCARVGHLRRWLDRAALRSAP